MTAPTLPNDAVAYLKRYGWLPKKAPRQAAPEALKRYQKYFDLEPTGAIDAATGRLIAAPRCEVPDFYQEAGRECKWNHGPVRYFIDPPPGNKGWSEFYEATYDKAFQQWANVANIKFERVKSGSQANIHAHWGTTGGGVLAWAYLPCGGVSASTRLEQRYGTKWDWIAEPFFLAVACHEIGHSLGLSHSKRGELMQPTYTPDITRPQSGDIADAVARYGKAKPGQPDPGPRPTPPPNPPWPDFAGTF